MILQPLLFVGMIIVLYALLWLVVYSKVGRVIPEKVITLIGLVGGYFVFMACMDRFDQIRELVARRSEVNWMLGAVVVVAVMGVVWLLFKKPARRKEAPQDQPLNAAATSEMRQPEQDTAPAGVQEHKAVSVTCSCGASMVVRKSREGRSFYGCSTFPGCRHTKSIS
ncbi:RsiW-degrading membrane proteinase PrsW (M82 family) [Paenibacillus mucilaginosus]